MIPLDAFAGLDPWLLTGAAGIAFGAAFIRGLTGFGMAIILVPLLGLVIEPGEAVVVGILLQLLIGPVGLKIILADADRHSALRISVVAMLATPVGIWLLMQTPPDVARLLIAIIAVGAFLAVIQPVKPGHRPGKFETGATGLASGILTGFAAMPGPPVVPYYLRQPIPAVTARASMMLVFLATSVAGTLASLAMGLTSWRLAYFALALFPGVLLGNWLGKMCFGKVSTPGWRGMVAVILGIAGISALIRVL